MAHGLMVKTSTRSNYSFEPIDDKLLSGVGELRKDANAEIQDEQFWRENRKVDLTTSERNMGKFVKEAQSMKGFNWIMFLIRPVVENFVETGLSCASVGTHHSQSQPAPLPLWICGSRFQHKAKLL